MKLFSLLFLLAFSSCSSAAFITFTGTFVDDDERFYMPFTVTDTTDVTITSFGYSGGDLLDTTFIPEGGFDTVLFLFSSIGEFIKDNDDRSLTSFDAEIIETLTAGSYVAVLVQYNNFLNGAVQGGVIDFNDDSLWAGSGAMNFEDINGDSRTGDYAIQISSDRLVTDDAAKVSAPSTLLLFSLLLLLPALRRKL